MTNYAKRAIAVLVTVIAIVIPLFSYAPRLYKWLVEYRLRALYRRLRAIEASLQKSVTVLEISTLDARRWLGHIRHAGAIFLGRHTPEAVGDYVGGPNHVLPTSRSARFSSGLGVLDFMKRTSLIACDAQSLAAIGPAALTLARAEGLDAHALSIAIRLNLPR